MQKIMNLQAIKLSLSEQREILLARIEKMKSSMDAEEIINLDRADLALDSRSNNKELLLLGHTEQQLLDINQALNRLEEGSYGICLNCGEIIQPARLEIVPSAALCIKCQHKKDSK
jgi:DnaK suppressor protein